MKVLIYGAVTEANLTEAELFEGIAPTSFISDGLNTPPRLTIPHSVVPQSNMMSPELAVRQQHMVLCTHADAVIAVDPPEHLVSAARGMRLPIYEIAT